jgi:parallel beta-helix repeat protein
VKRSLCAATVAASVVLTPFSYMAVSSAAGTGPAPAGRTPAAAMTAAATTTPSVGPVNAGSCSGVTIAVDQNAQAAIDARPAGTTFCFAAGLHRITKTLVPKANSTLASAAGAVLTGSVRLTNWSPSGTRWVTRGALPPKYDRGAGPCEDNVTDICYLREQIFVNGVHLTRVASLDKVVAGTFYGDYTANAVYLGSKPAGQSVEMSKTNTAIQSAATGVTIRGLAIEHFASAPQGGALVLSPGWKAIANDVRWNHAVGLMFVDADNAVAEKNLIRNNGQLGLGHYSSDNAQVTGNEVAGNNTDGFWMADWESGGIKTTWSIGGSVTDNYIHDNLGVGLWSDAYDDGRLFSGNRIADNAACGIRFEIGRNGIIENNTVTGNGFGGGRNTGTRLWDGGGINVNTSANVQVRNNTVSDNLNGIAIQSRTRGNGPGTWGPNVLRNVTVTGNKITMRAGVQSTGWVQNATTPIPAGELRFSANAYTLDALDAKRFNIADTLLTPAEWKAAGFDTNSTFVVG